MRKDAKRDLARKLRRDLTPQEQTLWYLPRGRRFAGIKFRRQMPIGPCIADFAAASQKLVIELDGGQHAENPNDIVREAYLAAQGWTVLRFWNNELNENREGVLTRIAGHLSLQI